MQHQPGSLFFVRPNPPSGLKPPFLAALTTILQLSFYAHMPAYVIADEMRNRDYPARAFTTEFIARMIGTEGVSVPNPYCTKEMMVQEAVGVLGSIIELYENSYRLDAIVQLVRERHHPVPKDLIASIIVRHQMYYERGFLGV
ncbi:hypothetical protein MMC07_007138 [Pseudocyphellaria aurata]|nr:hypothetical protein [Pseudocyphellaria aurata]